MANEKHETALNFFKCYYYKLIYSKNSKRFTQKRWKFTVFPGQGACPFAACSQTNLGSFRISVHDKIAMQVRIKRHRARHTFYASDWIWEIPKHKTSMQSWKHWKVLDRFDLQEKQNVRAYGSTLQLYFTSVTRPSSKWLTWRLKCRCLFY